MGALKSKHTNTQAQKILRYLKTHKKGISAKQAMEMYGICCLAERIRDLREKGHQIDNVWHKYNDENGHAVRYCSYVLTKTA